MQIDEAQREMRQTYLCAFPGAFVTAALWAASAAFGTWGSRTQAVLVLIVAVSVLPGVIAWLRSRRDAARAAAR